MTSTAPRAALRVGDPAPAFDLVGDDGQRHTLAEFRGRHLILYFYPRDNTPGCTQEACDFRDQHGSLKNAAVVGVSPDTVESHRKFKQKFELPFLLLADPEAEVAQRYGAWGEKNLYGKKSVGLIRSTFVIGPDGRLAAIYGKVAVKGHVDKVLSGLAA